MADLLSSVMRSSQSGASSAQRSAASNASRGQSVRAAGFNADDEQRKLIAAQMAKMVDTGNINGINNLEVHARKAGLNPDVYRSLAGSQPTEVRAQRAYQDQMGEALGINSAQTMNPFQGSGLDAEHLNRESNNMMAPTSDEGFKIASDLFDPAFLRQAISKQVTGLDMGRHSNDEKASWWQNMAKLKRENPSASPAELADMNAVVHGWMDEDARHLKGQTDQFKQQVTRQAYAQSMEDPEMNKFFKRFLPNANEAQRSFLVLNDLEKRGYTLTGDQRKLVDHGRGLNDQLLGIKLGEKKAEQLQTGRTAEEIAQEVHGTKLQREAETSEKMRDINRPYVDAASVNLASGALIATESYNQMTDIISSYTGTGNKLDMNRLPVGPLEAVRKRLDKYGVNADIARIRLRTVVTEFTENMYKERGKQLSDMEIKLAKELLPAMDSSPEQFLTVFSQLIAATKKKLTSDIRANRAAGRDVEHLDGILADVNKTPDIFKVLQGESSIPNDVKLGENLPEMPSAPEFKKALDGLEPGEGIRDGVNPGSWYMDANGTVQFQWVKP